MIKPKCLKKGDTIGIVALASPVEKERADKAIKAIENLGFRVKAGRCCYEKYGYLAGKDGLRANELNEMFADESVDGIICLRGGYGSGKILNMLDYDVIRNNPKVFIGYSDITAVHIAIHNRCNMVTFHGPMGGDIIDFNDFSKSYFKKTIMKKETLGIIQNPEGETIECLVEGKCEGNIVGGNLSLIASSIGTPYEIDTKDKILFIEEIDEEPYRIDRMLNQLLVSGKLNDACGIVLGDFKNCDAKDKDRSLTLEQVLKDIIYPLNKPTITNLKAGHCEKKITLPLEVKARLEADKCKLEILESGVI